MKPYLQFPFSIGAGGGRTADRRRHVRDQIVQVLFTDPGERIFRPEFGAGARAMVFEPNGPGLHRVAQQRITANLTEALQGEADPKSIEVAVIGEDGRLIISVKYTLAAIGKREHFSFEMGGANG